MKSGAGFLLFQQDLAPAPFTEYNTVFRLSTFIYKEKLLFFIRENKEKRWGERVENEKGKIGEMEKKGMEKCGWTAGEMFSII